MSYQFTATELSQIQAAQAAAISNTAGDAHPWAKVYATISEILSAAEAFGRVASEDLEETDKVRLWLDGACQVNGDSGIFSQFIREFTVRELELHYGVGSENASAVVVKDHMQNASDAIAIAVVGRILSGNNVLPNIADVADQDAAKAAGALFTSLGEDDSAKNDASAWSGTVLFSMFGLDETGRLLTGGNANTMDTLEDLRNVLYAIDAFRFAFDGTASFSSLWGGGVNLVNNLQVGTRAFLPNLASLSNLWAGISGAGGAADKTLGFMVNGHTAASSIETVVGQNPYEIVDELASLFGINANSSTNATNFVSNANSVFSTLSSNSKLNLSVQFINGMSASELADAAKDNIAYRYALLNFNSFVVDGDSSIYNAHNQSGQLNYDRYSDHYWQDRADLCYGLMSQNNQSAFASVIDSGFENKSIEDLATGKSTYYQPDSFANVQNRIVFGTSQDDEIANYANKNSLYGGDGNDTLTGWDGQDYLEGDAGSDNLNGGGGNDSLYGMSGNDQLTGGAGDDTLQGGTGNDKYYYTTGDGNDLIIDSDTGDRIVINGNALSNAKQVGKDSTSYTANDGGQTYNLSVDSGGLTITVGEDDNKGSIRIQGWDRNSNNFGITLDDWADKPLPTGQYYQIGSAQTPINNASYPTFPSLIGSLAGDLDLRNQNLHYDAATYFDTAYTAASQPAFGFKFDGGFKNDKLDGGQFADNIEAGPGDDIIRGNISSTQLDNSPYSDWLFGGTGSDTIYGGDGNDYIFSNNSGGRLSQSEYVTVDPNDPTTSFWAFESSLDKDVLYGGNGNDRMTGQRYADTISGDAGNDSLFGNAGEDYLSGGSGNDFVAGDAYSVFIHPDGQQFESYSWARKYENSKDPNLKYNDTIDGGDGNDTLYGEMGDDQIDGGTNDDVILGDRINDTDKKYTTGSWYGIGLDGNDIDGTLDPNLHGNDLLSGDSGNDWIAGDGGKDTINGGTGNDYLFGDDPVLAQTNCGNDVIDGGVGNDTIFGNSGNDNIRGGADNDLIRGDDDNVSSAQNTNDTISGDDGNDSIWGDAGNDNISGGSGNDQLIGDNSQGIVAANLHGNDTIFGDGGNDVVWGLGGNDVLYSGDGNPLCRAEV